MMHAVKDGRIRYKVFNDNFRKENFGEKSEFTLRVAVSFPK